MCGSCWGFGLPSLNNAMQQQHKHAVNCIVVTPGKRDLGVRRNCLVAQAGCPVVSGGCGCVFWYNSQYLTPNFVRIHTSFSHQASVESDTRTSGTELLPGVVSELKTQSPQDSSREPSVTPGARLESVLDPSPLYTQHGYSIMCPSCYMKLYVSGVDGLREASWPPPSVLKSQGGCCQGLWRWLTG